MKTLPYYLYITLLVLGASHLNTLSITQITAYSGGNGRWSPPSIADGKITWYANPTSGSDLPNYYVYDIVTGQTTKITNYSGGNGRWSDPVTSGGKVAWYANPTSGSDLPNYYVYDTTTGQTTKITNYVGGNGRWSPPAISGNKVVWYANPISGSDLPNYFVYDTATAQTTQITNYAGGNGRWSNPAIADGKVVWYANPTSGSDIPNYYVYDTATAQTAQITNYTGGNGRWSNPVTAGGKVAWYANPTSGTDLPNYYVYNTTTGQTTKITNYTGGNARWSDPVTSGDKVAWYANPTSGSDVPNYYVYDTVTGQTTKITDYVGGNGRWSNPAISGNKVVWYANPISGSDLPNYYVYDTVTGQTTQITNYVGSNGTWGTPVISDGKVAWYANPNDGIAIPNYFWADAGGSIASNIVTNANDSGTGSLRDVLSSVPAGTTITFDSALSGATIYLASPLILSQEVTVDGSALASKITISGDTNNDGTGDVQVFVVNDGVTATLDSLMITKGYSATFGGGVNNRGVLTITNSTISGNFAGYGGGISNGGTNGVSLTLQNSTISDNSADYGGGIDNGGIYDTTLVVKNSVISGNTATYIGGGISNQGTLTITDSTFSENISQDGGGIENLAGTLKIFGSAFLNNIASRSGGAINSEGLVTAVIVNTTFSGNSAAYGGGLSINSSTATVLNSTFSANIASSNGGAISVWQGNTNWPPSTTIYNTILANSGGSVDCWNGLGSGTLTGGNNIIETTGLGGASCGAVTWSTADPALAALIDDPAYFPLQLGSSAINHGNDSICTGPLVKSLDQRKIARPVGAHCDIGSFEGSGPDTTAPKVNTFTVATSSLSLNIPITAFAASDLVGVKGYKITTSSTPPVAGATGWSTNPPAIFAVGSNGTYKLYPWAKDAAGNVSAVYGSPRTVVVSIPIERIQNGGFNSYIGNSLIPTDWLTTNFSSTDGKFTNAKKEGLASVKIAGQPGKTKTLTQTFALNGKAGDQFTFSFWARGSAIPTAGSCQAQVLLYNLNTLKLTKSVTCANGTYATFQNKSLSFTSTSVYTKIVIKFIYSKVNGAIWFDAVSLIK